MNWQQVLWNCVGAASLGAGVAWKTVPAGVMLTGKVLIVGALVGVVTNFVGLFQRQPHNP